MHDTSTPPVDGVQQQMAATGLTSQQVVQGVQTITRAWTGKPEALQEALAKSGLDKVVAPDPVRVSLAQAEQDANLALQAPADWRSYNITLNREQASAEGASELVSEFGETLVRMGAPVTTGASFSREIFESMGQLPPPGPGRDDWAATQKAMAGKVGVYDDLLKIATAALARFPAELRKDLEDAGALISARSLIALVNLQRVLEFKEARSKSK